MYRDAPWGYIHEKKRANEAEGRIYSLEQENKNLKEIVKKLLGGIPLSDEEIRFLGDISIIK